MRSVGVVIGTFGDEGIWVPMAQRAAESVRLQTSAPDNWVHVHGDTLDQARNEGADRVGTDLLIFLDADDVLDVRYVEAMRAVAALHDNALFQPSTLGVVDGREDPHPVLIPQKSLLDGNFMVIGTMVGSDTFFEVGGFKDWPLYEDWEMLIRCWLAGATFCPVPDAVYRVTVRDGSRNKADRATQLRVYNEIRALHLPEATARGLV